MSNKRKEIIASCVEFICCGLITMLFLVVASLCFLFRDLEMALPCTALCIISGYCSARSMSRYFDLTDGGSDHNERK